MKKNLSVLAATLCGLFTVAAANAADIKVQTPVGEQIVPENPQRVVVLDFGVADSIRALGAKDKIVGFPQSGRIPQYLSEFGDKTYGNVGTLPEPDFEKINELNPDLIIAAGRQEKLLGRLKEIAPVLYWQYDFDNFYDSIEKNSVALGEIFDKEEVVKEKLATLNTDITALAKDTKDKTALILLVNESNISAFGDNSRYALVYQKFGFTPVDKNIKSSTHGMKVGFEYVAEQNPDYLLVVDRTAAVTDKASNAQKVLDNALIKQTKAYKNNQIVYLDAANWYLAFGGLESLEIMLSEIESAVKK